MSGAAEQMISQEHLRIVVCAHDDSGQGSTTGRLPFELDGTSEREPDGLTPEAERLEKLLLAAAPNMGDLKGETERVVFLSENLTPPRAGVSGSRGCLQPHWAFLCSVGPCSGKQEHGRTEISLFLVVPPSPSS